MKESQLKSDHLQKSTFGSYSNQYPPVSQDGVGHSKSRLQCVEIL